MIRITQLKLPIAHTQNDLLEKAAKLLRVPPEEIRSFRIARRSVDARKKEEICFIYTLDVETKREAQTVKRAKSPQIAICREPVYRFPEAGGEILRHRPVIVGCGPAGLFAGYMLAQAGYCPLILERGEDVDTRREKVRRFWEDGVLDLRSNVQFGEGGAGTFSDGKLNTLVKDPDGRNRRALEILAEHGADPKILWDAKPHIGTDQLGTVVKNLRGHITELGGTVLFGTQAADLRIEAGKLRGVTVTEGGGTNQRDICAEAVILAIGHSARDTFSMLSDRGVPMQPKAFAVGLRIQHPQKMIDESQYGAADIRLLGHASYKLTHQASSGRGVYSFCMCPGGYVVDASSETGRLAVNGMSDHDRAGENANSALIVTVTPADFGGDSPLAGIEYQRRLEEAAYRAGEGRIPVQLYGDFKAGRVSRGWGDVAPQFRGRTAFANLREALPDDLADSIVEGVEAFERKIRGFSRCDSILAGVESRTSSPVRIPRNERGESAVAGLFPCGEGAGYAGGILSAAMDGMRAAEEVGRRYRPLDSTGADDRHLR